MTFYKVFTLLPYQKEITTLILDTHYPSHELTVYMNTRLNQNMFNIPGDARVNEQPNLAMMHTLFLREHNRVARKLGEINPQWEDETLFQESRRIVVAEWQHIVYNEWLQILLGQENMNRFGLYPLTKGFSNSYKTNFDPRIKNSFAAAAFRIGHTMIPATIM